MADISATELNERLQQGEQPCILDVRGKLEYHTYNIGGINIPLNVLQAEIDGLEWNKNDEIIVICKIGLRSNTAKIILEQHGYHHVKNLSGGLIAIKKLNQTSQSS